MPKAVHPVLKSKHDFHRAAKVLRTRDRRLARCMDLPIEWRINPTQSPYTTLFRAVVHQQLAPAAASTILTRVKALFGDEFPTPDQLLEMPVTRLRKAGLSKSKTKAVRDLSAKALDGTLPGPSEIVLLSDEEIIERLTSIYGIGRWTVEMLLIFNLGRLDVFPVGDLAIRKGIERVFRMRKTPTPRELILLAERWRPHRTVASLYIWNSMRKKK
jgi:3-methyladenine DNA glycosylase/8-oxoguanine DNA glycosylase